MLYDLRSYIKKYRQVAITQVCREFNIDAQALKPILDIWVKKGVIKSFASPIACKSSCGACKFSTESYYCWVE